MRWSPVAHIAFPDALLRSTILTRLYLASETLVIALRCFVEDYFGSPSGAFGQGHQTADQPRAVVAAPGDRGPLLAELSAIEKDLRDLVARHNLNA
jgi:hypothetical protein